MTPKVSTFSLRLPISLEAAEKLASIQTAETCFAAFRGRGNLEDSLAFLSRSGGVSRLALGTRSVEDEWELLGES